MENKTHTPFQTPNEYFEQLPSSIMQKIAPLAIKVNKWTKIRSQLALAASFALLASIAALAVNIIGKSNETNDSQWLAYNVSIMDVEEYVWNTLQENNTTNENALSEDAVMNYLLAEDWINE